MDIEQALQRALDMGEHIGGRHQFPGMAPCIVDAQKGFALLVPSDQRQMVREAVAAHGTAQTGIAERAHGRDSGAGGTIAGREEPACGAGATSPSEVTASRTCPRIGAWEARSGEATSAPPTTHRGLSITE